MKINVRHEGPPSPGSVDTPERTCVWIVGDDGETIATAYPAVGEQVSIDVAPAVTMGAVEKLPPPA